MERRDIEALLEHLPSAVPNEFLLRPWSQETVPGIADTELTELIDDDVPATVLDSEVASESNSESGLSGASRGVKRRTVDAMAAMGDDKPGGKRDGPEPSAGSNEEEDAQERRACHMCLARFSQQLVPSSKGPAAQPAGLAAGTGADAASTQSSPVPESVAMHRASSETMGKPVKTATAQAPRPASLEASRAAALVPSTNTRAPT